jgi:branched-chain amino acid transport system ATP-binding protein
LEPDNAPLGAASESLLECDDLVLGYKRSEVVHGITLRVPTGGRVALLGANGAGKSSILKCISGIIRPRRGSIRFEGEDISADTPRKLVKRGIVHVPEGRRVFPSLTVRENLLVASFTVKGDSSRQLDRVLAVFPNLVARINVHAGLLSGGEQQMLAVGRAMMARPRLLLLDELSLGLAPITAKAVYTAMDEVFDPGLSVLLVEQNAKLALQKCNYVYVLRNGQVSKEGSADQFDSPEALRTAYLGIE